MKQSFLFVFIIVVAIVGYVLWSTGKIPSQTGTTETLPALTQTDSTNDIESDLNSVTITEEDEGFTEIQTDLQSL